MVQGVFMNSFKASTHNLSLWIFRKLLEYSYEKQSKAFFRVHFNALTEKTESLPESLKITYFFSTGGKDKHHAHFWGRDVASDIQTLLILNDKID